MPVPVARVPMTVEMAFSLAVAGLCLAFCSAYMLVLPSSEVPLMLTGGAN